MRFNTEAHGEALHARAPQIVQIIGMVEDEVQRLRELAACDESTSKKTKALIDVARVATRIR